VAAAVGARPAEELGAAGAGKASGAGEDGTEVVQHPAVDDRAPACQFRVGVEEGEDPVVLVEEVEVLERGGGEGVAPAALPVEDAHLVEGGEGGRRHQHGVGPGGVLVVAGREGETVPFDELAAVRLVPGHHQDAQQSRTVGEGEGGGALLVQLPGELVAFGLARPERPGVVEDQDLGRVRLLEPVGDGLERPGGEGVVAVQEEEVVAPGVRHAVVAGIARPAVLRKVQRPYARVPGGVLVDEVAARVRRTVVHRDHFEVVEGLGQHRVQALLQVFLDLVGGHDHAEPGHGTSMGSTRAVTAVRRSGGGAVCPATGHGRGRLRGMRHTGEVRHKR
jgi:hypothetical protein